jgi:hypothetical protein
LGDAVACRVVNDSGPSSRADWYPDPLGRFEYRYHDGRDWTADVSIHGVRYVDPVVAGSPGTGGPTEVRHGIATASMILGIAAVCIAWMPVFFVVGTVLAVVAIVLALVARRRRPRDVRGFATVGLLTGIGAVVLTAVGVWSTVVVVRAVQRFVDPPDNEAVLERCADAGGELVVEGRLTNLSDDVADYRVVVRVPRGVLDSRLVTVVVDDVDPGQTVAFADRFPIANFDGGRACRIQRVTGPLPFGVDPGAFDDDSTLR